MPLALYNSFTKKIEDFEPINKDEVLMYTCGPTVYDYAQIGNFRTYSTADFLYRTLLYNDYTVKYIMNLTDLGHLSGDNLGDADTGEDRLEKAAEKEHKSVKEIADFYIKAFYKDYEALNLKKPAKFTRATDYIQEQIELIAQLENKGFTYQVHDGIYFDTSKFAEYGNLSGLTSENVLEGARVEPNPQKKNPTDFALWKFSPTDQRRWQEYGSPWGVGFPGWHIECSAMILRELGPSIDLHLGGEDLKMTHHQNEIAQSECATGQKFVKYWVHSAFLQVDGGRMGKSLGNAYTVDDIINRGYSAMDLRFFYMTAHYRSSLNFTWESIQSSHNSLKRLYDFISSYNENADAEVNTALMQKFNTALLEDLNMPKAIAVVWEVLKSEIDEASKVRTLLEMDAVLGLKLEDHVGFQIPGKVQSLAKMRWEYKKSGIFDKADTLRKEMAEMGYVVEDLKDGYKVKRKL